MKGYLTSYFELFEDQLSGRPLIDRVEIPLIQRDYAQGRADAATTQIRSDFVEFLLAAVAGGEPAGLDFIYGRIDGTVFHPLDGQQRLTTLFLIHWYVASLASELHPGAAWTHFSYATRPSARLFCESLVEHPLPSDRVSPSEWITDQPWYLYTWRTDPTIESMLVVIDAIHTESTRLGLIADPPAAWRRLTSTHRRAVSFYLLPLEDMGSEDDLYINMNSRGKPLTPFENFKARFEGDIRESARAAEFAERIDGPWSNLMWPFDGGDNVVDDEFMRYIDYITEICELRDGQFGSGRIETRAKAIFGQGDQSSRDHLDFLFRAFDIWTDGAAVGDTFAKYFSTALPGEDGYDPDKVVLFDSTSLNLFEECCHKFESQSIGRRAFALQQSLLLYAVLLHLDKETEDFVGRVRILRNLLAASAEDEVRRQNMPDLLKDVEAIIVRNDLDSVSRLSFNQRQDERDKAAFIATCPDLIGTVRRLEDHPILRGTLSCFELTRDGFEQRASAFETAFADPEQWLDLTAALLATGNYQRHRPGALSWQFGTASRWNQGVWRELMTRGSRGDLADTRAVLGTFLDGLAACGTDLPTHLTDVVASWLAEREEAACFDWRYYLIKYPAMRGSRDERREGRTGIYWGIDGSLGYSLCMLRTYQLNGWYRDPVLLQVWLSSGVGDAAVEPRFSGPVTTARWLELERSGIGLRSVLEGFELKLGEAATRDPRFEAVISGRGDVVTDGERTVLRVPQSDRSGEPVDSVDRVVIAAQFLKELVAAGL